MNSSNYEQHEKYRKRKNVVTGILKFFVLVFCFCGTVVKIPIVRIVVCTISIICIISMYIVLRYYIRKEDELFKEEMDTLFHKNWEEVINGRKN